MALVKLGDLLTLVGKFDPAINFGGAGPQPRRQRQCDDDCSQPQHGFTHKNVWSMNDHYSFLCVVILPL